MTAGTPSPPEIPDHTLVEVIGRGSYGEVWLARNTVGTMRAVKIIRRAQFDSARPYEREFTGLQKYEPLSRSHEGLMDVLHVGRNDPGGYFYYVMELADEAPGHPALSGEGEGTAITMEQRLRAPAVTPAPPAAPAGAAETCARYIPRTLRTEIKSRGRLPEEDCLRHFISLAGALEHLHRHGLIHRDVKPSNIIFVGGVAKLADIGLVAEMSESRSFVGTEGFIPLEGPGTAQADVYSLGKVLYESVTGLDRLEFPSLPLGKGELAAQRAMIELNAVSMKACAPRAAERYQSAAEMMADLALMQSGRSVQDQHRTTQRLRLARRVSAVAGASALLAGGGWAVQSWRSGLERAALEKTTIALARAEAAEVKTRDALYAQALALARAESLSPRPGRRYRALEAIRSVAQDHPDDLALRNAAITALALPDFRETGVRSAPKEEAHMLGASASPSGKRVAITGADGVTRIFSTGGGPDAAADVPVAQWTESGRSVAINGPFNEDGSLLAQFYSDKSLAVRDTAAGAVRLVVPREVAYRAMEFWGFSDDGADFWVLQPAGLRVYSLRGGPEVQIELPAAIDTGGSHTRRGIYAFSARDKDYVVLVDLPNRKALGMHRMGGQAFSCAISPCGQWLLAGSGDGIVRRMALREPGSPVAEFAIHSGAVTGMAFHPDGDWFLSFSWDGNMGLVDSWSGARLATGGISGNLLGWESGGAHLAWREIMSCDLVLCESAGRAACRLITLPEVARAGQFANFYPVFSDDGRHLFVSGRDAVRMYDAEAAELREVAPLPGVISLQRAGSGRLAAVTAAGVEEFLLETGPAGHPLLKQGRMLKPYNSRMHLSASRDGRTLAALFSENAWLFPPGGPPRHLSRSSTEYRTVTLSADASWLAIRGRGTEVGPTGADEPAHLLPLGGSPAFFGKPLRIVGPRLTESAIECYDAASGERLWRTPLERVTGLDTTVSGDESMAAVVTGDRVTLVDCATGRHLATLQHPAPEAVHTAVFSPDSSRLAVTTLKGSVQVWNLRLLRDSLHRLGLDW